MRKDELKTSKDVEKRLDEWLDERILSSTANSRVVQVIMKL